MNNFSLDKRWLSDWSLTLSDGRMVNIGAALRLGGPGDGFALVPWALDRYQATLRLTVGEAWLAKPLLKYCWDGDVSCWPSFVRISDETGVPRQTLLRWRDSLAAKGYLRVCERSRQGCRRLDLRNLLVALAVCIVLDPTSRYAEQYGPVAAQEAIRLCGFGQVAFNLDFAALHRLKSLKPSGTDPHAPSADPYAPSAWGVSHGVTAPCHMV